MIEWINAQREAIEAGAASGFTTWMGILMYWMPVIICGCFYFGESVKKYREDLANRSSSTNTYYRPQLTIGRILGTVLMTVIPGINLFNAVFHSGPHFLKGVFSWLGSTLDFALVPDSAKYEAARADAVRKTMAEKRSNTNQDGGFHDAV